MEEISQIRKALANLQKGSTLDEEAQNTEISDNNLETRSVQQESPNSLQLSLNMMSALLLFYFVIILQFLLIVRISQDLSTAMTILTLPNTTFCATISQQLISWHDNCKKCGTLPKPTPSPQDAKTIPIRAISPDYKSYSFKKP